MTAWPLVVALGSAALNAVVGALALARGRALPLYRALAWLVLSLALWSVAYAAAWPGFDAPLRLRLLYSPLAWLPAAGLSFVWLYTGLPEPARRLRSRVLLGAGALILALLWSGRLELQACRLALIAFLFPTFLVGAAALGWHWRRAPDAEERNRRGYLLAAVLIGTLGGFTDFAPAVGLSGVPMLANLSIAACSALVMLAVTKHSLLDLPAAAGRAALFLGGALALAGASTAVSWATRRWDGPPFLNFLALSLLLLAAAPALRRLAPLARFLLAGELRRDQALERLERALERAADPAEVAAALAEAGQAAWGARAELFWDTPALRGLTAGPVCDAPLRALAAEGPLTASSLSWRGRDAGALTRRGAEAAAPVMRDGELVAVLTLSKPSAGFYDASAMRWLSRAAHLTGRAVAAAELTAGLVRADRLAQLGQLSASIAHEIRNPLSAMLGAVEVLKLGLPKEKESEFLDILKHEVLRLDGTLTELLDYAAAKPKAARCGWRPTWTRLETLLRQELPRGLALEAEGPDAELAVSGAHLQQILLNLVKNASRAASGAGSPRVRLSLALGNALAVLSVSDNGPGIPAEVLPRLFTPFASAAAGGTGLGLATVRRLAEVYGGRAWAENLEGGGARFSVELPLAKEAA